MGGHGSGAGGLPRWKRERIEALLLAAGVPQALRAERSRPAPIRARPAPIRARLRTQLPPGKVRAVRRLLERQPPLSYRAIARRLDLPYTAVQRLARQLGWSVAASGRWLVYRQIARRVDVHANTVWRIARELAAAGAEWPAPRGWQ